MDDFFHAISRVIVIIPVVILIIGLLTKFSHSPAVAPQPIIPSPTIAISPTNEPVQIDLSGPWICQFSNKEASVSAFIKDKQISATFKTASQSGRILVNGDCLYVYSAGAYSGEKTCGISPYLQFFNLLPLSMLDNNLFKTSLSGSLTINIEDLRKVLNSCKKEPITDETIFSVPKNVLFKNK